MVVFPPTLQSAVHEWRLNKSPSSVGDAGKELDGSMTSTAVQQDGVQFGLVDLCPPGIDCWNVDVLQFTVNVSHVGTVDQFHMVKLRYQNEGQNTFDEESEVANMMVPAVGLQKVIFPLRGNPNWWLGGLCRRLRLAFPPGWKGEVVGLQTLDPQRLIPQIDFVEKSRRHNLGPIVLTKDYRICPISFDVSHIKDANSAVVEITPSNVFFEVPNSPSPNSVIGKQVPLRSTRGTFNIDSKNFSGPGIYELRIRALNKNGNGLGLSSDHLPVFCPTSLN